MTLTAPFAADLRNEYAAQLANSTSTDDEKTIAEARLKELDLILAKTSKPDGKSRWGYIGSGIVEIIRETQPLKETGRDNIFHGPHATGPHSHQSKSGTCLVVWADEGRYWCSSCKESGDAAKWLMERDGITYSEAAAKLRARFGVPDHEREWNSRLGPRYAVDNGRLSEISIKRDRETREEIETFIPLSNFVAWCERETLRDDGTGSPTLHFSITGLADDGKQLPTIDVPAETFAKLDWVSRWGMNAVLRAGAGKRDQAREAIQLLSRNAPRQTVRCHLGWAKVGNEYTYLHSGGSVGGSDIQVDVGDSLSRYCLPSGPIDMDALRDAVQASLRSLDVAPRSITLPLYCAVWLAPLFRILTPAFAVWLYGKTGSLKSTISALAMSHFGTFTTFTPPITWGATGNSIERDLALARDSLLWLDDVIPAATPGAVKEMKTKVQGVLHAVGMRMGRKRLRADTSGRPTYVPAGLLLSTSELPVEGESTTSRAYQIKVRRRDVDRVKLSACQAEADKYPLSLIGFLRWLAPQMDTLSRELPQLQVTLRDRAYQEGGHLRQPDQVAALQVAAEVFANFTVHLGVMSETDAQAFTRETWDALQAVAQATTDQVNREKPTTRFLETLRTLLDIRRVYIADKDIDDEGPKDAGAWGWEKRFIEDKQVWARPHNATRIGWVDDLHLYLLGEASYTAVVKYLSEQGATFPLPAKTLYDHLREADLLLPGPKYNTVQVKISGVNHSVLRMPLNRLHTAWDATTDAADDEGDDEDLPA